MMQIQKITNENQIKVGEFYHTGKNRRYVVQVKEISKEPQRYYDKNNGEIMCLFYRVDIYEAHNMELLAENSIITFNKILDGKLKYFIPNLRFDTSYIGGIYANDYPKEFKLWRDMIRRCYDPGDRLFIYIGALGTIVCDRWLCFEYFLCDLKHMEGWREAESTFYKEPYIVDLYDCQRLVHPSKRIYGPGVVKLKKFKNSDIYKYIKDSNNSHGTRIYPNDEDRANKIRYGIIDIDSVFDNRSGMQFKIDTSESYHYFPAGRAQMAAMVQPYMSYADNYTNMPNTAKKNMCNIVDNDKR